MQKVQVLQGSPIATFLVTSDAAARGLATEKYLRSNLITNGDMEVNGNWASYGTPAVSQQDQTEVMTGDYSWLVTPNAADEGIQSDVFTTTTDTIYHYTIWVYPDDGTVASVIIRKGDDSGNLYDEVHAGLTQDAWNEIVIDVTELAGGALAYLVVHSGAQTSGDIYVANIFASRAIGGKHSGRKASRLYATVATHSVIWAVGGATPAAGFGHTVNVLSATDPRCEIILQNYNAIRTFKYINGTGGAKLSITIEF